MEKIVISKKIVEDSLRNGFKYIELNQFDQGIKYLTYAAENGAIRDQFLIYALIIANYNMGNFNEVKQYLKEIEEINVDNTVIKDTVNQIQIEISNLENNNMLDIKDKAKEVIEDIKNLKFLQEKIPLEANELKDIVKNTNDKAYSFILNPAIDSGNYEEFKKNEYTLVDALMFFEKFKLEYFKENKSELKMYKFYNQSLKRNGHSLFVLAGIKSGVFYTLLREKEMEFLRKEILYDILSLNLKGYVLDSMVNDLLTPNQKKINVLKAREDIDSIKKTLKDTPLYKEVNLYNYTINLVIKFYRTHIDSLEKLEKDEIITRILAYYYYSNIILDEELEEFVKNNYKLDKRKYKRTMAEINKLNLTI